jgi:hypothetical protein
MNSRAPTKPPWQRNTSLRHNWPSLPIKAKAIKSVFRCDMGGASAAAAAMLVAMCKRLGKCAIFAYS